MNVKQRTVKKLPVPAIRRRTAAFGWISVVLAAALGWLSAPLWAQNAKLASPDVFSRVITVEGSVDLWLAVSNRWEPAQAGTLMHSGDKLRTGTDSRATVRLADLRDSATNKSPFKSIGLNKRGRRRRP